MKNKLPISPATNTEKYLVLGLHNRIRAYIFHSSDSAYAFKG
jgi:hypothetical protein